MAKPKTLVTWFPNPGAGTFAIGFELYKGGFPIVSGDIHRTFIKVWIEGIPNLKNSPTVCQLFYKSSGENSNFPGMWLPTNAFVVKSIKRDQKPSGGGDGGDGATADPHLYKWFILKKPWYIEGDRSNPLNRFASNPVIAFVSILMGNWTKNNINKIKTKMKEDYSSTFYDELSEYSDLAHKPIRQYLQNNRQKLVSCDEYDIDMWVDPCTSWNWYANYVENFDFTPIIDPRQGIFWRENKDNKNIFLPAYILEFPELGREYVELYKMEQEGKIKIGTREWRKWNYFKSFFSLRPKEIRERPSNLRTKEDLEKRYQSHGDRGSRASDRSGGASDD